MSELFDPQLSLAVGVHAQPGVYALLLGSGVSSAAGIPTGWQVVAELVGQLAAARDPSDERAGEAARNDPDAWWGEHGDGTSLGYSALLEALSPGGAATRQALLARFFEPTNEDLAAGRKTPTAAHRAIAALVKRNAVRAILTTNFDRLLERALEDVGVSPVVLSSAAAIRGAAPLQHTGCTVVKLHGDYSDLEQRNTIDELSSYPTEVDALLDRVLDEYGLIGCGWSGDWDIALAAAMRRATNRRYPLYWAARSIPGHTATELIRLRQAVLIPGVSADDVFSGLIDRLDALDRLREQPLSAALQLAQLKDWILEPAKRIRLRDLILDSVDATVTAAATHDVLGAEGEQFHPPDLDARLDALLTDTAPLLTLLASGVFFDRDRDHLDLWIDVLTRLMAAKRSFARAVSWWVSLQHYPALLAMRTAGLIAVLTDRDDVLIDVLTRPAWRDPARQHTAAYEVLHDYRVLDMSEALLQLPRWGGSRPYYPSSRLLRAALRPTLQPFVADDEDYRGLCDRYEYRAAVVAYVRGKEWDVVAGEFIGDLRWERLPDGRCHAAAEFSEHADLSLWAERLGRTTEELTADVSKLDEVLVARRGRG